MALQYETTQETLLPLRKAGAQSQPRKRQRAWIVVALLLVDTLALFATFEIVFYLRFEVFGFLYVPEGSPLGFYSKLVFLIIPFWLALFGVLRLYDLRVLHGGISEYRRITKACTFAIILLLGLSFFLDDKLIISRAWVLMIWVMSIVVLSVTRFAVRRVTYKLRAKGVGLTKVMIVGANDESCQVYQQLMEGRNSPGMEVVGFVGERRSKNRSSQTTQRDNKAVWPGRWMGLLSEVRRITEENQIDEVIIASTGLSGEELLEVVRQLTTSNVEIRISPSLYQILTTGLEVQEINGLPFVTVSKVRITGGNAVLKRALDIVGAFGILTIFSPIFLTLLLLVKRDSAGPAIYRRRVVGQGGKTFDAYKFRTMRTDGDAILAANPDLLEELKETGKLKNDPRITKLGQFLRKTSIDELPQLINVLRGEMSLVGPRMITYQEMIKFGRWQSNLMTVKPGLTGLWQVSGRSDLAYEDRVRLDMSYIRNYSLWKDLQILFQTIPAVLQSRGAY